MHQRTQQLLALMAENELTISDVAELTGRSEKTVRMWRVKETARPIPQVALRLIEARIALRTGQPTLDLDGGLL